MSHSFHNKVIWITDASSGIGEALTYALAKICETDLSAFVAVND